MVFEQLAYVIWFAVPPVTLVAAAYWTYADAAARGSDMAWLWGVAVVLTAVAAVLYLAARRDLGDRTRPPSTGQRAAATFVLGAVLATPLTMLVAPVAPVDRVGTYPFCVAAGVCVVAVAMRADGPTKFGRRRSSR